MLIVGLYLRKSGPQFFQREAINSGINFVDLGLIAAQLRFLHDGGNCRVGFSQNSSVTKGIGDDSSENGGRGASGTMGGQERL